MHLRSHPQSRTHDAHWCTQTSIICTHSHTQTHIFAEGNNGCVQSLTHKRDFLVDHLGSKYCAHIQGLNGCIEQYIEDGERERHTHTYTLTHALTQPDPAGASGQYWLLSNEWQSLQCLGPTITLRDRKKADVNESQHSGPPSPSQSGQGEDIRRNQQHGALRSLSIYYICIWICINLSAN